MTATELIKQLSKLKSDVEVFVWIDGERLPVYDVDADWDDGCADINVMTKIIEE